MQSLRTERSAYLALAATANKPNATTAIDKAYAQREARKMQERLASLSFPERLKLQIEA